MFQTISPLEMVGVIVESTETQRGAHISPHHEVYSMPDGSTSVTSMLVAVMLPPL